MKKYFMACAAICAAVTLASCGSSKESAYRKAYEKAKQQEAGQLFQTASTTQQTVTQPVVQQMEQPVQQVVEQPVQQQVVTPVQTVPAQQTVTRSNIASRSETVTLVKGSGLKAYSVVVGSFGVRANAEGLAQTLTNAGYQGQVVYNEQIKMYRVVASTFDTIDGAAQSKASLLGTYPGAWLLYQK